MEAHPLALVLSKSFFPSFLYYPRISTRICGACFRAHARSSGSSSGSTHVDARLPSARRSARPSPKKRLPVSRARKKDTAVPSVIPPRSSKRRQAGKASATGRIPASKESVRRQKRKAQTLASSSSRKSQPRTTGRRSRSVVPSSSDAAYLSRIIHWSPSPPHSFAKELLRSAQEIAEAKTDWLGRRPFIMDVILDSRLPVSEYSEDIIMEALELSEAAIPGGSDYAFTDGESLDAYWTTQRSLWRGVAVQRTSPTLSGQYQVSAERSTASPVDYGQSDSSSPEAESDLSPI